MSLIRPFAGLRPVPEHAEDVVAPPYDVLNSLEARGLAQAKPWSFLHISKAEVDLPKDIDPYNPSVYAKAAENLNKLIEENILIRDQEPRYYVYRLTMNDHMQTGLVAGASVEAYDANRIRKHEFTRPAKENDRVNQIEALRAQTGPVLLAYRSKPDLDLLLERVTDSDPVYDLVAEDGIGHTVWIIEDPAVIDKFTDNFGALEVIYIADGHHRSAAASRVSSIEDFSKDPMNQYFLSVIFPHNQMKILDYNRVISDLNGLTSTEFLNRIEGDFSSNKEEMRVSPQQPGEFGMYMNGQWYRLKIKPNLVPADPVARLDVSLLANYLLEPVLGIADPRTDKRIDFVGGIRGLGELEKRVNSGDVAVAFSLFPTRMEDLMAVADAGKVMPPKSTWFEPKLADGLISHVLD